MKNKFLLILICYIFFCSISFAQEDILGPQPQQQISKELSYKYVGTVIGDHVNIRSGAFESYDVITTVNKDRALYVVEEKDNWVKVVLPKETNLWVNSSLVQESDSKAIVNKDGVNVRLFPNIKSTIITQVDKGEELIVLDKREEWLKIKAPRNACGWIHKNFIHYFMTAEEYKAIDQQQNLEQILKEADALYDKEVLKTENVNYDNILSLYKNIKDNYADTPQGKLATEKYNAILEKKAGIEFNELDALWKKKMQEPKPDLRGLEDSFKAFLEKYDGTKTSLLVKERLNLLIKGGNISQLSQLQKGISKCKEIEGVVYDLGVLIDRPATHKLMQGSSIVCLLKSSNCDLNKYVYDKVRVEGQMTQVKGWDIPVFEVKKITKLDWKGRMKR